MSRDALPLGTFLKPGIGNVTVKRDPKQHQSIIYCFNLQSFKKLTENTNYYESINLYGSINFFRVKHNLRNVLLHIGLTCFGGTLAWPFANIICKYLMFLFC